MTKRLIDPDKNKQTDKKNEYRLDERNNRLSIIIDGFVLSEKKLFSIFVSNVNV